MHDIDPKPADNDLGARRPDSGITADAAPVDPEQTPNGNASTSKSEPRTNEATDPIGRRAWLALGAICIASLVGHLLLLPYMPEQIPTHFGMNGEPNGWSDRLTVIPLYAMPLIILAAMYLAPRMDPRGGAYRRMGRFYFAFVCSITLLITLASWTSELSVFGLMPKGGTIIGVVVQCTIGALLIMVGNYLPKVKRNYTFGCKTPWALHDERNWHLTHRFAGIVFVVAGATAVVCGLFADALGDGAITIMLTALIGGALCVYGYSYLVFRNGNKPLSKPR